MPLVVDVRQNGSSPTPPLVTPPEHWAESSVERVERDNEADRQSASDLLAGVQTSALAEAGFANRMKVASTQALSLALSSLTRRRKLGSRRQVLQSPQAASPTVNATRPTAGWSSEKWEIPRS